MTPARLSQGIVDPPLSSDRGSVVQDRVSPAEGEALPSLPLTMVQNNRLQHDDVGLLLPTDVGTKPLPMSRHVSIR
jgi:hypothetical protein